MIDNIVYSPSNIVCSVNIIQNGLCVYLPMHVHTLCVHIQLYPVHSPSTLPPHIVTVGSLEPIPQSSFSVHVKAMHMERDSGFEREYQVRNTLFTQSTAMYITGEGCYHGNMKLNKCLIGHVMLLWSRIYINNIMSR